MISKGNKQNCNRRPKCILPLAQKSLSQLWIQELRYYNDHLIMDELVDKRENFKMY